MKKINTGLGLAFLFLTFGCSTDTPMPGQQNVEISDDADVGQRGDVSQTKDTNSSDNDTSRDSGMMDVDNNVDVSEDMAPKPKPEPNFDPNFNPSCDDNHAQILRYYQSFLGRYPDIAGANSWMTTFTNGTSLDVIAASFNDSPESQAIYAGLSYADFVEAAYQNSFGRSADPEGLTSFTAKLESGEMTRVGLLRFFADSDEMKTILPYAQRPFCKFVRDHTVGYSLTQFAPNVVYARSADGNVNAVFVEETKEGNLRVPMPESIPSTCADRSIPMVRRRPTGYFGGTFAINGNWFGCYLPKYFAGYSVSAGTVLGATMDGREGYLGQNTEGKFVIGYYPDTAGALPDGIHHAISGKRIVGAGALWPPVTTATTDPTFTNRNPRTGGGLTPEGYLVLAVVDGRTKGPGMTGTELGNLFIGFGTRQALTFDGGGSSALFLDGRGIVNEPSDGSVRSVGNQLVFEAASEWVIEP